MSEYFLGVDGGQSSTTAVIGDETGRVVGVGYGGPCNHVGAAEGRAKLVGAIQSSLREACAQAGLPLVRGKQVISLERQVRIAAGSLVLTGVILGWFVHPIFFGLSAFVGAGLVFAGVTDTCGMGLLLARMPWNRVSPPANENCSARSAA